ncbi:aldo/keto reductase [Ramlibacter monticola]|uniref:Aldo/keto reductase n=1 Tax=Ramlibacter monticola TaxID=1926872 RepID=A0A936YYE9_9BURK|nr:aldo/keto reductase [Ramlibacter monticola]MBL0390897.1 aldo/keto reductase [Ramlibacter monticola]
MHTRAIPSSGEPLPVIGCGTYMGFDRAPGSADFARLPAVLSGLHAAGGTVVDSSPMYGKAEAAVGQAVEEAGLQGQVFLATKVWTRGRAPGLRQMEDSLRLLRTQRIDLVQVHNLLDWASHLATLRQWKEAGRVRYLGITHYSAPAYAEVEEVLRSERLDFLQINYSAQEREAERRLLPLAAERGVAVLVNRPFGGGGLLRRLGAKPLPAWAGEIGCGTWSQLLLKFALAPPAVTCAIPGSGSPEHMAQNAAAGSGTIPPPEFWRDKMDAFAA